MADPLLAQSAINRLQSAAYELVLDSDSYRRRQRPTAGQPTDPAPSPASPARRRRRA